jgi:long-subunit acyl-CoA synthetase (AMP-forming)
MAKHEDVINNKNKRMMDTQAAVQNTMYGLLNDETALQDKLSSSLDQMKAELSNYEEVNKETRAVSQGLTQAGARSEDTKLQLVSDNYHYLLWSILAITLVIGGIRASRN